MAHARDEEDGKGYTWEAGYAEGLNIRDVLEEDESGSIENSIARLVNEAKRRQRTVDRPTKIRLGIMRYVYIVLDCSKFMAQKTIPPSRLNVTLKAINIFLDKFFEQNPIAQIGIIVCKDRKAERLLSLSGNVNQLKENLSSLNEAQCVGDFSLQNGLQLALSNLKDLPGHVSREVITIMASLSTIDHSPIFETFDNMKANNLRCSVIGLAAEVFVCTQLANITKGRYSVILDPAHLELELCSHANPPPTSKSQECNAVRVGFPPHKNISQPSFCLCHPDSFPLSSRGFLCPQCGARHCSLPAECRVCRLTLVAAPQLARAFRHLLPLPAFQQVDKVPEDSSCFACGFTLEGSLFVCKSCRNSFCFDCDLLLHDSLYVCPGCK